jgi:hypothetical protein
MLWTRRRGGGTSSVEWPGAGEAVRAVHGFHSDILLVQQPRLLGVPARRRRRCGGAEEEDWGLGLMQGKQSSMTPSPAGPTPISRWQLDHGRLRLGRRRPWLGLLRLHSGHARVDDDEDARLRPPPRMAPPATSAPPVFLPFSPSDFWWRQRIRGKSPRAAADQGDTGGWLLIGRLLGFSGCGCTTGLRRGGMRGTHPATPAL